MVGTQLSSPDIAVPYWETVSLKQSGSTYIEEYVISYYTVEGVGCVAEASKLLVSSLHLSGSVLFACVGCWNL